ncbi:hypothetical protein ScPMuIL_012793 [Solemya velum]
MSSIVLPRKKNTDFLAPSKTLQEAKKKLGVIYFDARLIEFPQNAYAVKESRTTLDEQSDIGLVDIKLPPAGFRFHSNGEPKLKHLDTSSSVTRASSLFTSGGFCSKQDVTLNKRNSGLSACSLSKNLNESSDVKIPKIDSDIDYQKEIQQLESIIEELTDDLANTRLTEYYEKKFDIKSHSLSFLRAHSHDSINTYTNQRYIFDPKPLQNKSEARGSIRNKSYSSCTACQFKLKHSKADYEKLQNILAKPCLRKWHAAPSGTFIESKTDITRVESKKSVRISSPSQKTSVPSYGHMRASGVATTQSNYQTPPQDREERVLALRRDIRSAPVLASNGSSSRNTDRKPSIEVLKKIAASEGELCAKKVKGFLKRMDAKNQEKQLSPQSCPAGRR